MTKSGRLVGFILIAVGVLAGLGMCAVTTTSSLGQETHNTGGLVLGVFISLVIAVVLVGPGIYLVVRGRAEEVDMVDSVRQRKILDMVKTRGQVNISDLVLELRSGKDQVRDDIYKLVGLGLFTGYVNWQSGVLYSVEASQLSGHKCPNCGGEQEFAGKGVITCKYCGSQIFL
jgi:DNA-directed RNA polymerase subunit RPC12/RpoP